MAELVKPKGRAKKVNWQIYASLSANLYWKFDQIKTYIAVIGLDIEE